MAHGKSSRKRYASKRYSASATDTIKVSWEGLVEFNGSVKEARRRIDRELRPELEDLGEGIAGKARMNAEERGLHRSGRLIEQISNDVSITHAGIAMLVGDTAVNPRDNYPYPGRLEYGDLNKPFLQPALAWGEHVGLRKMQDVVNRICRAIVK